MFIYIIPISAYTNIKVYQKLVKNTLFLTHNMEEM